MTSISFFVPGEPRGKGRPRSAIRKSKGGDAFVSIYTDEKTRSYEKLISGYTKAAFGDRSPFKGAVEVRLVAIFTIPKSWSRRKREAALGRYKTSKPDIDNVEKSIDGMNGIAWLDDSQIARMMSAKKYQSAFDEPAGLAVTITELEPSGELL